MTTTTTRTAKRPATTAVRVAKRPATKTTEKPAGRVATKRAVPKVEPVKVSKPKVTKVETVEPKAPRVARRPKAVEVQPEVEPTTFAFLMDGEVKATKAFHTVEAAKSYGTTNFVTDTKKGWKLSWKGNRGGYTLTRHNSNGKVVDSPLVIKRANADGSVPQPKEKPEPLGFDEFGYRNGSDSSIAAHILIEGGESRGDINEKVSEAIKAANGGSLLTRNQSEKVIPTIVGNVFMRLRKEKGYKVESTWRLVPPTE
jgi:hypothetical protein